MGKHSGMALVLALSVATMPVGILLSALRDRTLRRRSRFWLRFAGLVLCMIVPWMVALAAAGGEEAFFTLLWAGLAWGMLLAVLGQLLLFHPPDRDTGPSDDDGRGPGPDDDPRPPDRPRGGIPLPDADQPATRVRGPHSPRPAWHVRRSTRERERRVTPQHPHR
jgi:hypothetical protein